MDSIDYRVVNTISGERRSNKCIDIKPSSNTGMLSKSDFNIIQNDKLYQLVTKYLNEDDDVIIQFNDYIKNNQKCHLALVDDHLILSLIDTNYCRYIDIVDNEGKINLGKPNEIRLESWYDLHSDRLDYKLTFTLEKEHETIYSLKIKPIQAITLEGIINGRYNNGEQYPYIEFSINTDEAVILRKDIMDIING
jgi:hypothetical protein